MALAASVSVTSCLIKSFRFTGTIIARCPQLHRDRWKRLFCKREQVDEAHDGLWRSLHRRREPEDLSTSWHSHGIAPVECSRSTPHGRGNMWGILYAASG